MDKINKILALDIGESAIGCAIGDSQGIAIEPINPIIRNNSLALGAMRRLLRQYQIEKIIIGYPLLNGKKTMQTRRVKGYAHKIKKHFPHLTITFQDETLSTWATRKKYRHLQLAKAKSSINIDSFSAMEILRDYFKTHENS